MYFKIHKAQGIVWIILIVAIIILIGAWVYKNPSSPSSTIQPDSTDIPQSSIDSKVNPTPTTTPANTTTLQEIDTALKDLNDSATNIDKGINDSQLDITQ